MKPTLSIADARPCLLAFSCVKPKQVESDAEKQHLQAALRLFSDAAAWENLGVCAETAEQGFTALSQYLEALGYDFDRDKVDLSSCPAPIYIKFNGQKQSYLTDSYDGGYRGVLVSFQAEDDRVCGTYGHFPLDLFA
jgi:hypothetical protein